MSEGMNRYRALLTALALVTGFLPCFAEAARSTEKLSTSQLRTLVAECESVKSKGELKLLGTGPGVTVLTTPHEGASKRDLQIEAIFVARALIEGAPGQVENVKVIFAGRAASGASSEEGLVASVDKAMVLDYGSGKVSAKDLLAAVRLTPVQPEVTPNVVPGPQLERRLLVWQRIEKLSQQGTGVQPFKARFDSLEQVAASGDRSALSAKLEELELLLSEQEEQVALARKVAQGKGVISPVKITSSASSKNSPVSERSSKNSRLGSEGAAVEPTLSGRSITGNFGLRRLYNNRQLLLKTLSRKGDPNFSRVERLFRCAEEKLGAGKEDEAMISLGEIKSLVDKSEGVRSGQSFAHGPNFDRSRRNRFSN